MLSVETEGVVQAYIEPVWVLRENTILESTGSLLGAIVIILSAGIVSKSDQLLSNLRREYVEEIKVGTVACHRLQRDKKNPQNQVLRVLSSNNLKKMLLL